MEDETIIAVSVLGGALALTLLLVVVLFTQVAGLRRALRHIQNQGPVRVQKATLDDKNHAFHNPAISPDEELARRGFSMYAASADADRDRDVESARESERQTGGQFVEELERELDHRHQRRQQDIEQQERARQKSWQPQPPPQQQAQPPPQQHPPPFLLQSIEENKKKTRSLANPVANGGRQSDTNPNFIY